MGKLKTGHIVETGIWLGLALILYIYSFEFEKDIEIYKFGATAWPRSIILLIVIAAIGQLFYYWKKGEDTATNMISEANADGAEEGAEEHSSLAWYISTFGLLAIPFAYMLVPDWIIAASEVDAKGASAQLTKIVVAAILLSLFLYKVRSNLVGGMLSLPIFFAAMLQDMGFYALAPFFILGVMYLMGERRLKPMLWVMLLIFGILLTLFVSILYVGLPTGNIHPFYDFGTWVVTVLQ
ncbi:MAG: hypothetical protein ACI8P9_001841 [Parasphingorhabdus sp.]|jgi:hypothetical protein